MAHSLLLQKGAHTGPALEPDEFNVVSHWIDAELAFPTAPGAGMTNTSFLPTAPLYLGDYSMSFGATDPIYDSNTNLTFHLGLPKK